MYAEFAERLSGIGRMELNEKKSDQFSVIIEVAASNAVDRTVVQKQRTDSRGAAARYQTARH